LFLLTSSCNISKTSNNPKPVNGQLDLSDWNFESTIRLDGQWEFYWQQYIFDGGFPQSPDAFVDVPSNWNDVTIDGESLSGQGYATYRLHIVTSLPEDTMLGLRLFTFSSAYSFFADDKLIATNGVPGTNAQEETGEYKPQAVFFSTPSKEFDLIFHVSNFTYARGGFWYSATMGKADAISALNSGVLFKEIFIIGALFIIALFYLAVFLMNKEFKYSLFFSIFCILLIIASDCIGQMLLFQFFPYVNLNFAIFLWYSSVTWVFFFLYLYIHEIYKSKLSSLFLKVFLLTSVIQQIFFIFTPVSFYTGYLASPNSMISLFIVICGIYIILVGIKSGQLDGWLNISGVLFAVLFIIHDNLYWMNVFANDYGELYYIGFFIFLFFQMIIQAKRIKKYFDNQKESELAFLQAQIKPHFLYNTLNTCLAVSYYDAEKSRELLIKFSGYLRHSFDFKNLSQTVPLKDEVALAKAYTEFEVSRFEEKLKIRFNICDTEVSVPILTLQPVIENAINHGVLPKPNGGTINISIKKEGNNVIFCVSDDGIGIDAAKLETIFCKNSGRGIGLYNIDKRLKKIYGKGLCINSKAGEGTQVSWSVYSR
jgi:hypothetical protein